MAAGRPTDYNEDIAREVCLRMADGESLRKICSDENMPDKSTVLRWVARYEAFRDQYAQARELSQEAVAEEYFELLDETPPMKPDGSFDAAAVSWYKNRADGRKWYLSKIAPKKYGDKIQTEHSGSIDLAPKTDEELKARAAALLGKLKED
jgi:hypothetical protein